MKREQLFTDLSDEQSEKVVGGVGARVEGVGHPVAGAGVNGWGGLGRNFTAPGVPNEKGGGVIVVHPFK